MDNKTGQMNIKDKVKYTSGKNRWQTNEYPELGIKSVFMADGPHGLRIEKEMDTPTDTVAHKSICYPAACSLASSWDRNHLELLGKTLAAECLEASVDILLGPGVNIKRSPLCGRNFEYFSEDPVLAGYLGAAYINGLQREGIGACVKHFACNNQETERFTISAEVDEQTLHEIYLLPFKIIVENAKPWSIMCSYNRLNGVQVAENTYLLDDILRKTWGFDGVVISDWAAVNDKVLSLTAGVDLQMPGPCYAFDTEVINQVEDGFLSEKTVDKSVSRLFSLTEKCHVNQSAKEEFNREEHHSIARQIAADCVVLLKNDSLLPITEKHKKITVAGYMAQHPRYQGGGSSHVNSFAVESPLEEISRSCSWAKVDYASGYDVDGNTSREKLDMAASLASESDLAVIFIGLPESYETEGRDRKHMKLPEGHEALVRAISSVQENCAVVVLSGSAVELESVSKDSRALLYGGLLGETVGGAIADILTGKVNPSGKLSESFPLKLEDTPSFINFPGTNDKVYYGERFYVGYRWYDKFDKDVLFPFGHGLSYSSFVYENISLSSNTLHEKSKIEVSFYVKNSSDTYGSEIIQLYISSRKSFPERPVKELKKFCKINLESGESKNVKFTLDTKTFSFYSVKKKDWITDSGEYEILIGSSSRDIRLESHVNIDIENNKFCKINRNTQIGEIISISNEIKKLFTEKVFKLMDRERIEEASFQELLQFYSYRSVVKLLYWTAQQVKMKDLDFVLEEINQIIELNNN